LISKEITIHALVRPNSKNISRIPNSKFVITHEISIDDINKLEKILKNVIDVIYHFAWESTGNNRDKTIELQIKNIYDSLKTIEFAKKINCKRFIGAGSQAEYGPNFKNEIFYEEKVPNPISPYAICKNSTNLIGRHLAKEIDLEFIWVRIFSVYGQYDRCDSLISTLIEKGSKNENIYVSRGTRF
jgi:UDP-glucose 4-epimerase